MNKRITTRILIAAAGIILAGCAKYSESLPQVEYQLTVKASFDGEDTKTTVQDGGTSLYWEAKDEIKVFCENASGRLISTNSGNSLTATFTGSMNGNEKPATGAKLYGLYPYREDATFDGTSITTTIPDRQVAVAGTFDRDAIVSMAVSNSENLKFRNVCGGLRFSLTHEGIRRIVFESNGGEYIAGEFNVCFANSLPEVAEVIRGNGKIIMEPENGECFQTGVWYYMTLLPGTLSDGYTVTFCTEAEATVLVVEHAQTIKRNVFGSLSDIDSDLEWEESELKQNSFVLQAGVKSIGRKYAVKYLSSFSQNSFEIADEAPSDVIPEIGDIIFVETGNSDVPYISGKVSDIIQTKASGYAVQTEDVGLEDIFEKFNICEELTLSQAPMTIYDDDGNEYQYDVASSDIWDELTTPLTDTTTVNGKAEEIEENNLSFSSKKASGVKTSRLPGSIRIANKCLHGNLYVDFVIQPDIRFDAITQMVLVNIPGEVRIGFEGNVGLEGGNEIINILKSIKIPVGSAGIFTFYWCPNLSVFCEGNTTIGGDVRLEFHHSKFLMTNDPAKNNSYTPLEKDSYFSISTFKADGAVGIGYGMGIHSFVFNEKLLGFGFDVGGKLKVQVSGQFPSPGGEELSKNMTARIQPSLEITGYVDSKIALNKPDKLEYTIVSRDLPSYDIDLLPLFKLADYTVKNASNQLDVYAKAFRKSFIRSTEGGYSLFKKGQEKAIQHKRMYGPNVGSSGSVASAGYGPDNLHANSERESAESSIKVVTYNTDKGIVYEVDSSPDDIIREKAADYSNNGLSFDIEKGIDYEIAPYAVVNEGECIYGEKIPLNLTPCPDSSHVHAVDLGLSVNWACCNVGATKPEEEGNYYAWGETSVKNDYSVINYKHWWIMLLWVYYDQSKALYGNTFEDVTKYNDRADDDYSGTRSFCWANTDNDAYLYFINSFDNIEYFEDGAGTLFTEYIYHNHAVVDNKFQLDQCDDAASVNMGGSWRMPTKAEYEELINNCTITEMTLNGKKGRKLTSNIEGYTDKWIFIPYTLSSKDGSPCHLGKSVIATYSTQNGLENSSRSIQIYWTSSLGPADSRGSRCGAYVYDVKKNNVTYNARYQGCSVRAVCPK